MSKKVIVNENTIVGRIAAYEDDIPFRNHVMNGFVFEQDLIFGMLYPFIKGSKYIHDIGAHTGHHTLSYSVINPDAQIYAYEPQRYMYELLEYNTQKCKNVNIFNVGLGNEHSEKEFQQDTFGGSAFLGTGGEKVKITTLDTFNPKGCDFMKIDVEGYEPFVLKGAIDTIKKYRPIICFEDNNSTKVNFNSDESSHKILKDLEYVIHPLVYDNYIAFPIVMSNFKNISGIH